MYSREYWSKFYSIYLLPQGKSQQLRIYAKFQKTFLSCWSDHSQSHKVEAKQKKKIIRKAEFWTKGEHNAEALRKCGQPFVNVHWAYPDDRYRVIITAGKNRTRAESRAATSRSKDKIEKEEQTRNYINQLNS